MFYNILFNTQQAFVFDPLRNFCNVHDHIVFCSFLFFSVLNIYTLNIKNTVTRYIFKESVSFFKEYNRIFLKIFFFATYNDGKFSLEEENIIKDIKNLLRLKKELNHTAIKDIRNLFKLEKETKENLSMNKKIIINQKE